jgi:hypothetical protein
MDLRNYPLKNALDRYPAFKKAVKGLASGALRWQDRRRIHQYHLWLQSHDPSAKEMAGQRERAERFAYRPLVSIITPTYNTPEVFFREMVASVLDQTYQNWELIIVDDASPDESVRRLISEYTESDSRIKHLFLSENHHIAGATNEAIKIASGEFVSLFDHDDVLRPNALFEIVTALNERNELDFIYTDEDKIIGKTSRRQDPFFKPDWNPDFLHAVNYITHFTTIRKSVLDRIGYEDPAYNGAQDWELFLRVTRSIPERNIFHIPKILYSWRVHDNSTAKSLTAKPYVIEAQRKTIEADLLTKGYKATAVQDGRYPAQWRVQYTPSSKLKVSVVLLGEAAQLQYEHVRAHTDRDYEVLCVESGAQYSEVLARIGGEYAIFINRKVNINDQHWIDEMLGDAEREEIGFVVTEYATKDDLIKSNSELFTPDTAAFIETMTVAELTMHLYRTTRHNIPSVSDGVCMVRVSKMRSAILDIARPFNIAELSTSLSARGYRHLYNPYIKMVK